MTATLEKPPAPQQVANDPQPSITSVTHSEAEENGKFGTFMGVFVPCILMVFGVIIFLRLGWVVGNVGLPVALFIITMATVISMISTLSMAAIATNIQVGKGGVYYIISRSLGLEIGSAVGIPLYIKQSLSLAFCIVGFSESLHDLFPTLAIKNIGICTLSVLTFLAYTSVKGALKVQVAILGILLLSFFSLFSGGAPRPMHPDTFAPATVEYLGFWAMFAIFFPAITGVESVVSLSGDLKNPSYSLPRGAISATIVSYITYVAVAVFLVRHVPLERLVNDALIMQDVARFPSLIVLGIWGATLSSALGGLLGAPRTLQAMSNDGVLPKFFSKTFGKSDEPHVATLVTFSIAFFAVYFGTINIIAPLMTMICLVCYGMLNLSAGIETLIANPSWRPTFPVHWGLSLSGAALCLICMLMIDAGVAIISLGIVIAIYAFIRRYKVQKSWEDIREGIFLYLSRYTMYHISSHQDASKSWRPHFLVFSKATKEQSLPMLRVFQSISQSKGFITIASFVSDSNFSREKRHKLADIMTQRFQEQKIQSFVHIKESQNANADMRHMIKYYGLGPLRPNTVVLGMLKDGNDVDEYVDVIHSAYSQGCNVVLMSNKKAETPFSLSEPLKGKNGEIHLWWDDKFEDNSELMLIFSYMLQKQSLLSKDKICIKAIIPNERAKDAKKAQFKALSEKLRLPLEFDIYVSQNSSEEELFSLVKLFSKEAKIIFLSLRFPPSEPEAKREYVDYLRMLSKKTTQLQDVVLVLGSEHTPLEKVLQ